jgi:hypothetical protein
MGTATVNVVTVGCVESREQKTAAAAAEWILFGEEDIKFDDERG